MSTTVVVPCFNEAARIDRAAIAELVTALCAIDPANALLLIDDGSTDATAEVLRGIEASAPSVSTLLLPRNVGKAEAVRRGMLGALERGAGIVGFVDADLATPPAEIVRLVGIAAAHPEDVVVMGSRVMLLGHRIDRSVLRHYVGRVFATLAGAMLAVHAYDSQCGAKFFQDTPALRAALSVPFRSRWGFDLELLGRLQGCGVTSASMREEPLAEWRDVGGSKVTARSGLRTFWDLVAIRRDLRKWTHEHRDAPEITSTP